MIKFLKHSENLILKFKILRANDPNMVWGRCVRLLQNEYGSSGEKAAFEMARTGTQGGLYAVLISVAKQMVEEYASNEIRARISHYWHSLSVDEQLAATDEYLSKFGHLLPSELTERSAARIKTNFIKVLEEHMKMVKRIRNVGTNA